MKILNIVGALNVGGQETLVMNLLRFNHYADLQIDVLCLGDIIGRYEEEAISLGANVYHLPRKKIDKYMPMRLLFRECRIKNFLKDKRFDVVHIHTCHAIAYLISKAFYKCGIKNIIIHSHNSRVDKGDARFHYYFRKKWDKLGVKKVACSRLAATWLFGSTSDVKYLFNGINTDKFLYNNEFRYLIRKQLKIENKIVFGHIANFNEAKNHEFLIEIFHRYVKMYNKDAVLVMIGKGKNFDSIKQKVSDLNMENNCIFLGSIPNVSEVINIFDVFVLPSLYEGLPIVAVEAQANGLPCIISDTITEECIISPSTELVALNQELWVEKLKEFESKNRIIVDNISKYDIKETIKALIKIYTSF